MTKLKDSSQKTFSDYDILSALELLDMRPTIDWQVEAQLLEPSPFLTLGLETARKQIVSGANEWEQRFFMELFFVENLRRHPRLRMWQERYLDAGQSPFRGLVDFAFTPYQMKFTTPFLLLAEAKKEDFEQGWGQCLLAMKASQILNDRAGLQFDIYGIVSTGKFWEFGKLTVDNRLYISTGYAIAQPDLLLGAVDYLMTACEAYTSSRPLI